MPFITRIFFLSLLSLLFMKCSLSQLIIKDISNEIHEFDIIPVKFYNNTVDAFFVGDFFVNGSLTTDTNNVDGKILLSPYVYGVDDSATEYGAKGAIAYILGISPNSFNGRARYQLSQPRRPVDLVTVTIVNEDYDTILSIVEDGILWVAIKGNNSIVNPYEDIYASTGLITQIVLGVFFMGIILVCVFLLFFELRDDIQNTFTRHRIVLLACLMMANGFRFAFCIYDPFSYQGLSTWPINTFVHVLNVPLTLLSEMIVSLLWFKTLHLTLVKKYHFLVMMRLPFIIFICIFSLLLIFFCCHYFN
eukprot:TRINITY_DN814_c0_g1_i5.p1 TRINITY_DN814_c0_g1~~TRINITY_DN814_c0_g1_i5.p1  ORF type:complete len:305 (+),score=38.44 TRINITY_DN814_c0_g1_i5:66-980(+)